MLALDESMNEGLRSGERHFVALASFGSSLVLPKNEEQLYKVLLRSRSATLETVGLDLSLRGGVFCFSRDEAVCLSATEVPRVAMPVAAVVGFLPALSLRSFDPLC